MYNQQPMYYPQSGAVPDQLAMYRQPYAMPMQQNPPGAVQTQQNTAQSGMIWVQGEAAAKAYPVAPGATVMLWDSEQPLIYIKTADPSGMPNPMRVLAWKEHTPKKQDPGMDRLGALEEKYNELAARLDALVSGKVKEGENAAQ